MAIISAFPGCGKTTFVANHPEVMDSDSSKFDKAYFPGNYIEHIKVSQAEGKHILVSTHKSVREALVDAELIFVLIYPKRNLIEEYRQRYLNRDGANGGLAFADLITRHWDTWIDECEHQQRCFHLHLDAGQFLSDILTVNSKGSIRFRNTNG